MKEQQAELSQSSLNPIELEYDSQGRRIISGYILLDKLSREEAKILSQKRSIPIIEVATQEQAQTYEGKIVFVRGATEGELVFGKGAFGTARLAQRLSDKEY